MFNEVVNSLGPHSYGLPRIRGEAGGGRAESTASVGSQAGINSISRFYHYTLCLVLYFQIVFCVQCVFC